MSTSTLPSGRRRPVNLTLNSEVVEKARRVSHNLSATVESLLVTYIDQQTHELQSHQQLARQTALAWNEFHAESGSFADEYIKL